MAPRTFTEPELDAPRPLLGEGSASAAVVIASWVLMATIAANMETVPSGV